jgi:undecaprenyl-diphosphatase
LPPGIRRSAGGLAAALVLVLLIGWGLGELARATAQATDLAAVRDLAADRTATLTAVARALSLVGSGYVVFPLTLVAAAALFATGRRAAAAALGLSTLGAVVIANIDKLLVGRPRPPVHHLEVVSTASFPSGHASQSTALFLGLALVLLAARASRLCAALAGGGAAVLVFAIAFSRIYLGVHYPTDVAGGILLAGAWTGVVAASVLPRAPAGGGVQRSGPPQRPMRAAVRAERGRETG